MQAPSPLVANRAPAKADATAVVKRLAAGAPGTKRQQRRFGDALLCVRYRLDTATGERLTTVELVIERRPAGPAQAARLQAETRTDYLVRVAIDETDLRQRVKAAGGRWDPKLKLWHLTGTAVRRLKLKNRVVTGN
jgi:hypothetical protein